VLVLSGDQIYRMDFRPLVGEHRRRGADVTIAAVPVAADRAGGYGVLRVGDDDRVTRLVEKPQGAALDALRTPPDWLVRRGGAADGRDLLANMGIYIFRAEALLGLLAARPDGHDMVADVLLPALADRPVYAHLFDGYWEDLGTIRSYHEAHMALCGDSPPFDFHSPEGVIYTRMRFLPAARVEAARADRCLLADGCEVGAGADLERCVVGLRSRVGAGVRLREAVVMGADRYETPQERADNRRRGVPDIGVGAGSVIERAILDKDCRIGRGVRLVNAGGVDNAEGDNFVIRDGIVVIPDGTTVPDGTVI
jgi:glucose-1-phosphate adenylyltransferase